MKQTLATLCVIGLVLLAGCSAFQPGPNQTEGTPTASDPAKQEAITEAAQMHLDATAVTVDTVTNQTIRIQNESQTVETISKQDVTTVYNYSEQTYHTNGTVYRQSSGSSFDYPVESYYTNGTQYRKVTTENGTSWQTQSADFSRDTIFNISEMSNEDTLEHFTFTNNSESNGTYVYTADLTNESVYDALIESSENRFTTDSYQFFVENANKFDLTVVVDSETNELRSISISLETTLTGEQVKQSDAFNFSDNAELDNVEITVLFETTKQYSEYNNGQTVTVPENVKN